MTDLDPLRRHLADVSDEELAKEHAQGRDAYRSSEAWELVQEESPDAVSRSPKSLGR